MQEFINDLSNYLKDNIKNNSKYKDVPIIEDILAKNQLTTGNANAIRWKEDEVITKYAEKMGHQELYFVKDNKKIYWLNNERHFDNDVYTVLKVQNSKIEKIEINKEDMPKNICTNDVFRIENDKYVIDKTATKGLREEIENMAKEIIDKQNLNLNKHRKEGHLYIVTEKVGNSRFLYDLTELSKIEFEEVNFPKDLLNKVAEGTVVRYINGKYEEYAKE